MSIHYGHINITSCYSYFIFTSWSNIDYSAINSILSRNSGLLPATADDGRPQHRKTSDRIHRVGRPTGWHEHRNLGCRPSTHHSCTRRPWRRLPGLPPTGPRVSASCARRWRAEACRPHRSSRRPRATGRLRAGRGHL